MSGLVILLAALAVTAVLGLLMTVRNGRFSTRDSTGPADLLDGDDLGAPLGERVTLVQFSSAFCSPCRATRTLLTDIAGRIDGVEAIEVDAESHLELVRRLQVMRTPTVLVLDARGATVTRASGLPRREQVLAAVDRALGSHA